MEENVNKQTGPEQNPMTDKNFGAPQNDAGGSFDSSNTENQNITPGVTVPPQPQPKIASIPRDINVADIKNKEGMMGQQSYSSATIKPIRTFALDIEAARKSEKEGKVSNLPKAAEPETKDQVQDKGLLPKQRIEATESVERKGGGRKDLEKYPAYQVDQLRQQVEDSSVRTGVGAEKKDDSNVSRIKTYRADALETIQKKGLSKISMAAAESEKRAKQRYKPQGPREYTNLKNLVLVVVSLVLIFGGGGISWFLYKKAADDSDLSSSKKAQALIFSDEDIELKIGRLRGTDLVKKLDTERENSNGTTDDIINIYPIESGSIVEAGEFLSRISSNIPASLTRSVSPEYMFGVHIGNVNEPFFIFKTKSFESAFANMLLWEATMNEDLSPLFGPELSLNKVNGSVIIPRDFHDVVVRNIDTRLLRKDDGSPAIFYAFPSPETIVIATNEDTFFEVFRRLSTSKN